MGNNEGCGCANPDEWSACPIHRDGQDQTEDED